MDILYYASNGTWNCNATAFDLESHSSKNGTNTTIDALYAINTTSDTIDYGLVQAGSVSNEQSLGLTNIGNQPISVYVKGFGGNDSVAGDGWAMLCDTGNNITINQEKFGLQSLLDFSTKTPLTSMNQMMGLNISKQTSPLAQSTNQTYWQIFASPMPIANCLGTIRFTAGAS